MSNRQDIVSVWLIPEAKDAARFQPVIDRLADEQNAPSFSPHVSLGSFTGDPPELDELLSVLSGLELKPIGVDRSPVFTTSLFLRFELSAQLKAARDWVEAAPMFRSGRRFDPHISLCYGAPVSEARIADEIQGLTLRAVRFDRLRLMRVSVPVETHDDVARWSSLGELVF